MTKYYLSKWSDGATIIPNDVIKDRINEIDEIIRNDYDGDEQAYFEDTFNMLTITLEFGIPIDSICMILLRNLQHDTDRYNALIESMKSSDMREKIKYPGGYKGFLEDCQNGIYDGIIYS